MWKTKGAAKFYKRLDNCQLWIPCYVSRPAFRGIPSNVLRMLLKVGRRSGAAKLYKKPVRHACLISHLWVRANAANGLLDEPGKLAKPRARTARHIVRALRCISPRTLLLRIRWHPCKPRSCRVIAITSQARDVSAQGFAVQVWHQELRVQGFTVWGSEFRHREAAATVDMKPNMMGFNMDKL